jgi:hypothetical protein
MKARRLRGEEKRGKKRALGVLARLPPSIMRTKRVRVGASSH